jgi:hypothetical protein
VADDSITVGEIRWRWMPARSDPCVEDLVCGRPMVPHGDRGDRSESRGPEDEAEAVAPRNDCVVRELVLYNYVGDDLGDDGCRRLRPPPRKHFGQGAEMADFDLDLAKTIGRQPSLI